MLTSFGKTLRKIRIDHDELLKDMASKLGVTVAYLSAVENGKREVPDSWIDIISCKYGLADAEVVELQKCAYESKDNLRIDLNNVSVEERELALAFARSFKTLTEEEMKTLNEIFKR